MEKREEKLKTKIFFFHSAKGKKAFTLFELIVVILIISAVYFLFIPRQKIDAKAYGIKNIKEYLKTFGQEKVTLICTDEGKKCTVYSDEKVLETDFVLNQPVVYEYKEGYLQKQELYAPALVDTFAQIAFKFSYDAKRDITDSLFVQIDEEIVYFSPYFNEPRVFGSLGSAEDFYASNLQKLRD